MTIDGADATVSTGDAVVAPTARRWSRRWWAVAAVALVAVVAAAWYLVSAVADDDASRPLGDPDDVELPEQPADPAPLVAYLEGEGAALVEFHREMVAFAASEDPAEPESCRALVEDRLQPLGEPEELGSKGARVDDPDARDLFQNELLVSLRYLSACSGSSPTDLEELTFSTVVVDRYLDEVGVR